MSHLLNLFFIINILYLSTHSSPIFNSSDSNVTFLAPQSKSSLRVSPPYLRPTWIDIDLNIVHSNVRLLKTYIGEKVHLMAVVKANAYGYGMLEIARTAMSAGATWLGVATLDEALVLRRQLSKDASILVLGYVPIRYLSLTSSSSITVTGISLEWIQEADRVVKEPLDFHLKIDTGMKSTWM